MYVRSIFIVFFVLVLQAFSVKLIAQNITGFSPASVCSGSSTIIQVDGSGFLNTVGVKIGLNSVSYNIVNDSQIQILNFNGASTGRIVVETNTIALTSPNDLIVKDLNSSLSASVTGTICESTAITYTVAGGSFYEFFVNGVSQGSVSPNNSITFIPSSGDNIFAKAFDSSMNCSQNTNVITAQLQPISKPQLISTTSNISVCNNDPISSSIIYQLTAGANDAFITGLPTGVTAEISGNNVIITGTPNISNAQDYNYVITPVGVPCHESAYGTISVALDAQLNLDLSSGNTIQVLCEESPLEPIIFNISGGATSASVTGLPSGVSATYDSTAKVLIIEGTPSDNVSQEQKYNYTVTTSGSSCTEQVLNGSITVNPLAQLTLLPTSGSLGQILCEGEAIEPILIALEGGADLINVSGLPNGIVYSLDTTTQVASIYGTPTGPVNIFSEFSYVVSSISDYCTETTLQGNLRVNGDSTLTHDTNSGDTIQVLCEESPLEPIIFNISGGATSASVTGLPSGVSATYDSTAKVLIIEGTPSDNVSQEQKYNYTVTTSGSSCTEQVLNGSITVNPLAQLTLLPTSGSLGQILCEGEAIEPILIALEGGADLINVSGLPNGIVYSLDTTTQVASIYGTPTGPVNIFSEFSYVVSSISDYCTETTLQGNLRVNGDSTLTHDTNSGDTIQVLCEERPLEPIIFNISGGATSASVTGLPSGVSATYDSTAKVLIIEGTPSDNVSQEQKYNYTVTTSGSSCTEQVLNGSITVNPLAQLTLLPTSGSLGQILCEGEAIEPILIALEGGDEITNVSGLPDGVEYSFNSVTKTLTVSGTPSANISADENSLISFAAATSCNTTYLTGNIFRTPQPTLRLISHLQTQNQLVCGKTLLEEIQYQLIDGATTVDVTGLPPGVTWIKNGNYIEISGIPDDVVYETNFEYSIFTEGNGCSSTLNFSIIVTPNTMDKPEAESVQSFCIYDAPKIKDIVVYANNLKWYSADGLSILDPETPLVDGETYYAHNEIIVSESSSIDRYACRSYPTTIQVFVQDTPPPQILEPSNRFCLDGQYTLTDIKVNFEDVVWYSTYTSDLPLSLETPLESMTYYAASIDPTTGCESMLRTEFEVYVEPCTVKVYNALSVNGDGLNEKLMIDNISFFPANEIVIYNRNGRVVYKTSGYGVNNNFFRGYSNISSAGNSKVLPMGTYYYTFTYARPLDGKIITTNGFINLVTN